MVYHYYMSLSNKISPVSITNAAQGMSRDAVATLLPPSLEDILGDFFHLEVLLHYGYQVTTTHCRTFPLTTQLQPVRQEVYVRYQ
jgi:hypothetical protein